MTQMLSLPYVPFTIALGILFGLLLLEVAAHVLGLSLMSGDGPDIDLDAEIDLFDLAPDQEVDLSALLEASEMLEGVKAGAGAGATPEWSLASTLGLGRAPFILWLAAVLLGFGLSGILLQSLIHAFFGHPLPASLAAGAGVVAGLVFARAFSHVFAALLPKMESSATRMQFLGGLRGTVTQGTARRGAPAEIRIRDRHGNLHYPRVEPFLDDDVIEAGHDVLTVRLRRPSGGWELRILPLS